MISFIKCMFFFLFRQRYGFILANSNFISIHQMKHFPTHSISLNDEFPFLSNRIKGQLYFLLTNP